jgi:hypothetical protein
MLKLQNPVFSNLVVVNLLQKEKSNFVEGLLF